MNVRDVMTVSVVTLSPGDGVRRAARLLLERRIGGAPVVDERGRVLGMLTVSDLLPRPGANAGPRPRTVVEVMSRDVVALREDMGLSEAVRFLERCSVKRAPVLRGDRLVGIVTRSDLLRPYLRTDSEIRAEVEMDVLVRTLGVSPRDLRVAVRDGVVSLEGAVPSEETRKVLLRLVRGVDGVVDVVDGTEVRNERASGVRV